MKYILLIQFLFLLVLDQKGYACALDQPPEVFLNEGDKIGQYWDLDVADNYWSLEFKMGPRLLEFQSSVRESTYVDQKLLLTRQLFYLSGGNFSNSKKIRDAEVGVIRKINCMESLLFEVQAERKPMFEQPTEFLAYFLFKRISGHVKMRVLYYSIDKAGIGSLVVPHTKLVEFIKQGWTLQMSLHNHNFDFSKLNYLGGVAPSTADVNAYLGEKKSFQLKYALITNGFDTVVLESSEFSKLSPK